MLMLDYRTETFLALYEEMNYRKTAQRLNITQPGVTQHIHFLENHYGVKLFEYDGRSLKRTRNAEMLKRHLDSMRAEENAIFTDFAPVNGLKLKVGATKTIGEFVIIPHVRRFLCDGSHNLDLVIDNTENLLHLLEHSFLDFAIIEGVFDKAKYPHHLFKKEKFMGICGLKHPFANKKVSLQDIYAENIVVREPGSGTRRLLEQAMLDRGYKLDHFNRCASVSNFGVICDLVATEGFITFAYEPIAKSREDLAVFEIEDMQIQGEFNFVYCNAHIAKPKIDLFLE